MKYYWIIVPEDHTLKKNVLFDLIESVHKQPWRRLSKSRDSVMSYILHCIELDFQENFHGPPNLLLDVLLSRTLTEQFTRASYLCGIALGGVML